AVTAKNLAKSIKSFHFLAIGFGILSSVTGILVAKFFGISSGPAVVLTSVILFIGSFIFKKR
ncbi:MAG: metal ABC transporter permease, partial [Candidatus Woesebacteria bacterium]|nr:metal ABC transporter permease [Candidatus Woesebacteria bacterium]